MATMEEFAKLHGDDCVNMGDGWLLFSDGAMAEATRWGALQDPPADLYRRYRLIVKYHEELLRRVVTSFNELKRELHMRAAPARSSDYCNCDTAGLERLKTLRTQVRQRQKLLDAARKKCEEAKPEDLRRRETSNALEEQMTHKFLTDLNNIKI